MSLERRSLDGASVAEIATLREAWTRLSAVETQREAAVVALQHAYLALPLPDPRHLTVLRGGD